MARRRNKPRRRERVGSAGRTESAVTPQGNPGSQTEPGGLRTSGRAKPGRRKRWAFRILAAVGGPCLVLVLLETAVRLSGYGYPTAFLLSAEHDGRPVLVQNDRFGWKYFGPRLARRPEPLAIDAGKPSGTVRIIVFGESAAFGDPQPAFGLPRMMEAMLHLRYPEVEFEVVNAAMTGINSHAVREIAEDCTAADADAWVVYMGNNEVVGPFGAGTIFGTQTAPLAVVRANIGLKEWRLGQLLAGLVAGERDPGDEEAEWGGMQMFLEHMVRRDDSRLDRVYRHLRTNFRDVIELGRESGAGVVVGTVAVNLRDCAPFASEPGLAPGSEERAAWDTLVRRGTRHYEAGEHAAACKSFAAAAEIDDTDAGLHFLWGRSLLAHGDVDTGREHLESARDLDLLRFRCDSRMQEVTRDMVREFEDANVRLTDAAEILHTECEPPVSGRELFHEHVHLTFEGNYQLARLFIEQLEALPGLRPRLDPAGARPWPTVERCAERLAWGPWARRNVLAEILARLRQPPFTSQLTNEEQVASIVREMQAVSAVLARDGPASAVEQCRRAVEAAPDDATLQSQLALVAGLTGDLDAALTAAERAAELLPHSADKWYQLGLVLAQRGNADKAITAFREAILLAPEDVWARHELARTLVRVGRHDDAVAELQTLIEKNPRFGAAYLTLGMIHEQRGEAREAAASFRQALAHRLRRKSDLAALARVCVAKGWLDEAAETYGDAIALDPLDPALHLEAAQCLAATGQDNDAEKHFAHAIRLAPDSAELRYRLGVFHARREDHAAAAEQFAAAVERDPELVDARLNLGMALLATERRTEALSVFEEAVARYPENETAQKYAAGLREELGQ